MPPSGGERAGVRRSIQKVPPKGRIARALSPFEKRARARSRRTAYVQWGKAHDAGHEPMSTGCLSPPFTKSITVVNFEAYQIIAAAPVRRLFFEPIRSFEATSLDEFNRWTRR